MGRQWKRVEVNGCGSDDIRKKDGDDKVASYTV